MINSDKIRERMKDLHITQRDVAASLMIAPPTVSQKIAGLRPMYLDEAQRLAELLKIDPVDFGSYFFHNTVA